MEVVSLNVGGHSFTTSLQTLTKDQNSRLYKLFSVDLAQDLLAKDADGKFFVDRDGKHFGTLLNFLRDGTCSYPEVGTSAWEEVKKEVEYFNITAMLSEMNTIEGESTVAARLDELGEIAKKKALLEEREKEIKDTLSSTDVLLHATEREKEALKVELQKVRFEKDKTVLEQRNTGKQLMYNLLIVGVTGTGKSSTLNTLLDKQACKVSGGQAQGTRGCVLQDGSIDANHFVSYIDTQGLGADTSVTDAELLSQIMMSTESILQLGLINNILISFDVNSRATPANMANQLTLMELFSELRQSCFVAFTKWNTNAVQVEWNTPLRKWVRKWRKAKTVEQIKDDPPSYEMMYQAYCQYIVKSMSNDQDGGAFSKMGTFLAFFEARVLWMYNLDAIQIEDKEEGDLEPYLVRLYEFYREKSLETLNGGSTVIRTEDLTFLKSDTDTMAKVASQLIRNRDEKIFQLEMLGSEPVKRKELKKVFKSMTNETTKKIATADYRLTDNMDRIAKIAGIVKTIAVVGCVIQ